ncbi:MAG: hypothetical protein O2797_07795 [Bacteroidetes bacterium]|nr:hypothetical protein [Bacteroidota bacterium]MDA1334108.1 hypothetical protein [Bacteroidota bacterium]
MNNLSRNVGFALIIIGVLTGLSWFIEPLRKLFHFFWMLPRPLQFGSALAAVGLLVLIISLLFERWTDRHDDADLKEDFIPPHSPTDLGN